MRPLDDLSETEFESVMLDVFRHLGYEDVRRTSRDVDGCDATMERLDADGASTRVFAVCEHAEAVDRPVVRKLHESAASADYDGPVEGLVVTNGEFTGPAEEYAWAVGDGSEPPVELVNGNDLRETADRIGLDIVDGTIEIWCEQTLPPTPDGGVSAALEAVFADVDHFPLGLLPEPAAEVTFEPAVAVTTRTNATFETPAGDVHEVDETAATVVDAGMSDPGPADDRVARLVDNCRDSVVAFDERQFRREFDAVSVEQFERTETAYREWVVDRQRDAHTTTVTYTGDDNATHQREYTPDRTDITIEEITPVYVPHVRTTVEFGGREYPFEYYSAGERIATTHDGVNQCVHCEEDGDDTYTFCPNCHSISCSNHTKTERYEGKPVCTDCAVTKRFALSKKYFYNDENQHKFHSEYAELPLHQRAMENKPLVAATVLTALATASYSLVGILGL